MENTTNIVLDKKLDTYRYTIDNVIAPQEITVTITLCEYRELVKLNATREYELDKKQNEIYELRKQNEALKNEIEFMKTLPCVTEKEGENHE